MELNPNFKKRGGTVPVITQDSETGEVLMLAYANPEAYEQTVKTGIATYYSTSRKEVWVKGQTSGNKQSVREILIDCDEDAVIYKVTQRGKGACHTGQRTCFYRSISVKLIPCQR
jgi:phosphoribosyl-AMP cyclohydrolase